MRLSVNFKFHVVLQPVLVDYPYVELEVYSQTHPRRKVPAAKTQSLEHAARVQVTAILHAEDDVVHIIPVTVLNYAGHGFDV